MDQIIKALSIKFNLPESTVRSGVGILLNFLKKQAAGSQFEKLLANLPGAQAMMASAPSPGSGSGLLSGLLGGNLGGAAEALGALQKAGIPLDKAAPLAGEFLTQARQAAGPETVNALLEQIPVLKSFLSQTEGPQESPE